MVSGHGGRGGRGVIVKEVPNALLPPVSPVWFHQKGEDEGQVQGPSPAVPPTLSTPGPSFAGTMSTGARSTVCSL